MRPTRRELLDDEIKSRLEKLNALSDLINSLELQFDEANTVFQNTLKCSTDRLSSMARTLGTKSIKHGRDYNAAKLSVEQSQSDCQRACVLFEQANKDHQVAKKAIQEAELKLRKVAGETASGILTSATIHLPDTSIDLTRLNLNDSPTPNGGISLSASKIISDCDNGVRMESNCCVSPNSIETSNNSIETSNGLVAGNHQSNEQCLEAVCLFAQQNTSNTHDTTTEDQDLSSNATDNVGYQSSSGASVALTSEELNQAIMKLVEAEKNRGLSERQHSDKAKRLIDAQKNLMDLEREYGSSIRRSQLYFDEAKRFNAKLNSVKGDICRISDEILAAKRAYARTLGELEQFSDDLHLNPNALT